MTPQQERSIEQVVREAVDPPDEDTPAPRNVALIVVKVLAALSVVALIAACSLTAFQMR